MNTQTTRTVWIVVAIIIIVLAAWYWWPKSQTSSTSMQTSGENGTALDTSVNGAPSNAPQVQVLSSVTSTKYGAYLVATNGMTLYKSNKDGNGVSNCTGTCLQTWIPYTVNANDKLLGSAPIGKRISTLYSADTTHAQLTYDNAPLYFYAGDTKAGDVKGNGIGGVWSVVAP